MRTYVVGDIHGAAKALEQVLGRAGFDRDRDRLICLGDICDGWPDVQAAFNILLSLKHLVYLLGNHDFWALQWMKTGASPPLWLPQGGKATIKSYHDVPVPEAHIELLASAFPYFIEGNNCFVHGGFDPSKPLSEHTLEELLWDRTLVSRAMNLIDQDNISALTPFSEVFIGHTPTLNYGFDRPIHIFELWMMDTGAGWQGRLSMIDIATFDIYQSDPVPTLYPKERGRF
ncbi:MAG: serine/threonine protein phosphatase [Chlorobi bacterium]|nr:serine/threonine protein phosphatase [Chlorobiota bacterium]